MMPPGRRTIRIFASAFVAAGLVLAGLHSANSQSRGKSSQPSRSPGAAGPRAGVVHSNFGPGDTLVFSVPQFIATGVSLRASNETGWDKFGADEVKAVFANFNPLQQNVTPTFGNVDAGETKKFPDGERCIALQTKCDRGQSELHFGIALWEEDRAPFPFANWCNGWLADSIPFYYSEPCSGDDFIGRVEITHSTADLVAALPAVGSTKDFTVKPTGGAGSYTVTYRITRLANIDRSIVIHLPPLDPTTPTITLEAEPYISGGERRVRLSWSGATTASVDIYRNGTKVATAPNTGDYRDTVPVGTYQYRVCDLNATTACSASVSVTVT